MSFTERKKTYSNIYEEDINDDTTLDLSSQNLENLPKMDNKLLCILYLQNNKIKTIPDDFFPSVPCLKWLDLRNNLLTEIPATIKKLECLTHLLLKNNQITSLPIELGTLNLKVLQLSGNPLTFPPKEVISAGITKILQFLRDKRVVVLSQSDLSEKSDDCTDIFNDEVCSYNSVMDEKQLRIKPLVQMSERELLDDSDDESYYTKTKGKCSKLAKSRFKTLSPFCQSSKYLRPIVANSRTQQEDKMRQSSLKDLAIKKHKALLNSREKVLQERKNIEQLRNWRTSYRNRQLFNDSSYKLDPTKFPYDTNIEYMTFLTREDIEKDLPDKYKKKLVRRSKQSLPRKSVGDVNLARKIKQLFENLEAIDLNRGDMTPRTEQKALLDEIQKISEIKQKLTVLSSANTKSVVPEE